MIHNAKRNHWDKWLKDADKHTIWVIGRFIKSDPSDRRAARTPPLVMFNDDGTKRIVTTNKDKAELLHSIFFLLAGPPLVLPPSHKYPTPAFKFQPPTNIYIHHVINALPYSKASGPDDIPNEVFAWQQKQLLPYLGHLFRATFSLQYYPPEWQTSVTVVLWKPGCIDYTVPNLHCPIALLNSITKLLSACVAQVIVYETEKLSLLLPMHFLGQPARSTTDALYLFVKTVKEAWH